MKELIEENYNSIIKRGLINEKTILQDFLNKLDEEVQEFKDDNSYEELADIILVCLNIARHYNIDIENELINKINKNKNR
jgi:predicted house-cleaning noncanonical NTP pyrophosphatase (MazG superfamily)